MRDIHRIGGGGVENLRLKPLEERLDPPGISVLKAPTPADAAKQVKAAFPAAIRLHEQSQKVGSSSEELVRGVGFDVVPHRTKRFPSHHRIIHADGVAGFNDENLRQLSGTFVDTDTTGDAAE